MKHHQSPGRLSVLGLCAIAFTGCGGTSQSYVERGNGFVKNGKLEDAAIQFQKAIQKDPKLGDAHYRLGLLELQRNQPVQAYLELQKAAELMPGNVEANARLGQLALSLYNADPEHPQALYDQASKSADELRQLNPDGYDANLLKGALSLVGRKPGEAANYLRKAVNAKPNDPDSQLGLARALAQNEQVNEGLAIALDLVRKNKGFGPAYDFLYEQYASSGKMDAAQDILKLKVSNNPKQAAFLLELARYYAVAKRPSEMTAVIQRIVDNPKDFPDGRLLAGDFYSSAGQPEEALRQYQKGLDSSSKEKGIYRKRLVRVFTAQHKWQEASAEVAAILKDKPEDQEAKLVRALLWLDEGKPENLDPAIAELRMQLSKRPQDSTLHFQLGNALTRKGDQDGARREWADAAQENRNYLPPRYALVQLDLAQGKTEEAVQVSDEILALQPRDPQARLLHATALISGAQYQRARTELYRLASQYPKTPQIQFRLGLLALAENKYKEGEEIFRQLETATPGDPQIIAGLAQAYEGQNQAAKAVQLLEDALGRNPNSAPLRAALGRLALSIGKFDLAINQYKQLAAASPKSMDLQISLASAYLAKGEYPSALTILKQVVSVEPKSAPAAIELAHAYVLSGQIDDAKASYRHVLELQPENANALNDLAYLLADSGANLDEALSLAQRGLQGNMNANLRTSLSDTLGWIYLKKNMYDSALQTFQTLVKNNPDNMTFRYHLGATFFQVGDKKKARAELEAALAIKPPSSDEPKIRELLAKI